MIEREILYFPRYRQRRVLLMKRLLEFDCSMCLRTIFRRPARRQHQPPRTRRNLRRRCKGKLPLEQERCRNLAARDVDSRAGQSATPILSSMCGRSPNGPAAWTTRLRIILTCAGPTSAALRAAQASAARAKEPCKTLCTIPRPTPPRSIL